MNAPAKLSGISPVEHFKALKGARKGSKGWWSACCPAHADKGPSLGFIEHQNGNVGFVCRAGCDKESILAAMGLTWADAFAESMSAESRVLYHRRNLEQERERLNYLVGIAKADPAALREEEIPLVAQSAARLDAIEAELKAVPVRTVEQVDFPDLSSKGRPLNTIENMQALMQAHGVGCRYNLVSKAVELTMPGWSGTADNRDNTSLAMLASAAARFSMPRESLVEYVKTIADRQAYSPVAEWIQSRPWDGVDRLPAFLETIEAEDSALRDVLLRRWLISAVAAAMKPVGFWCKGVLTLQGEQNLGKTSWFRALVPQELRHLILEGMHLDAENRDHVMTAVSHWLVELGELEATLRRDIESLKAFISKTADRLRRPYDRTDSEYARRTVFFASVNSDRFLKDATGNTRFWVLRCKRINHAHGIDMQQLWAQVFEQMYRQGEQWHLTSAEESLLWAGNDQFREISPIEEMIPLRFDLNVKPQQEVTATQVLLALGFDKPTRAQQIETGQALKSLGVKSRRKGGRTLYHLPYPKTGNGYSYP